MDPFATRLKKWTPADIRNNTEVVRHAVGTDLSFRYALRIPVGWEPRPAAAIERNTCKLVSFVAPSTDDAEISVTVTHLAREVSPARIVEDALVSDGWQIVERRLAYGPLGWVADFLSRRTTPRGRYTARTSMAKDDTWLYRIDCSALDDDYEALSEPFLVSLASFRLTDPTCRRTAEPLRTLRYVDPFVHTFKYPASWSPVPEKLGERETWLRLDNHSGDRCAGRLYFGLKSRSGSTDAADILRAQLSRISGVDVPALETREHRRSSVQGFDRAVETIVQLSTGAARWECRGQVFLGPKGHAFIGSMGPPRASSPTWWAANERAFEIVRDSLFVLL